MSNLPLPWEKQSCLAIFHCIEIFFIIQDFWATRACPENRVCPENFQARVGGRPPASYAYGNRWKWKGESWLHYRNVLFISVVGIAEMWSYLVLVQKITASRENCGELLGDEVMKTASHRNCSLQVTSMEFEQLLQGRKWELVFTYCKATLLISVTIINHLNQSVLCSTIQ